MKPGLILFLLAGLAACGERHVEKDLVRLNHTLTSAEHAFRALDTTQMTRTLSISSDSLNRTKLSLSNEVLDLTTAQHLDSILMYRARLLSIRKLLPKLGIQLKLARGNYETLSSSYTASQVSVSQLITSIRQEQKNAVELNRLATKIRSESGVAVNYLTTIF